MAEAIGDGFSMSGCDLMSTPIPNVHRSPSPVQMNLVSACRGVPRTQVAHEQLRAPVGLTCRVQIPRVQNVRHRMA